MSDELVDHSFNVNHFKDGYLKFKKDEGCHGTIYGGMRTQRRGKAISNFFLY